MRTLRLGARRSPLARAQADWVAERLRAAGAEVDIVGIVTTGDTDRRDLTQIGGTGVFAAAVRERLLDADIDLAVHSLKDLPTAPHPGLVIAAIPEREDVRDVLVGARLAELRDGSRIGTGSPRRAVQLLAAGRAAGLRLAAVPVRGNVDTRLGLIGHGVDAVLLAAAGLRRLGRFDADGTVAGHPAEVLAPEVMLPAAGQGALAVEIAAAAEPWVREVVARLDHAPTRREVAVERSFLAAIEAGCLAPVGVLARAGSGVGEDLTVRAVTGRTIENVDSSTTPEGPPSAELVLAEASARATDPEQLGRNLARDVLAKLGRPDRTS